MKDAVSLLAWAQGFTGLSFDDILREVTADTEQERAEAMAINIAKMAEHRCGDSARG